MVSSKYTQIKPSGTTTADREAFYSGSNTASRINADTLTAVVWRTTVTTVRPLALTALAVALPPGLPEANPRQRKPNHRRLLRPSRSRQRDPRITPNLPNEVEPWVRSRPTPARSAARRGQRSGSSNALCPSRFGHTDALTFLWSSAMEISHVVGASPNRASNVSTKYKCGDRRKIFAKNSTLCASVKGPRIASSPGF